MEQDFNPWLTPEGSNKGGERTIEHPDRVQNIAWQTRRAPLTDAENALADALLTLFAQDVDDLAGLAQRLQAMVPPPAGATEWTEAVLRAELARLGA